MKVCIHRRAGSIGSTIYVCMHACMHVLCMYVRYSARRSLCGALIGALGDMDVSQVEYACIMKVCIYRRAKSTGSAIYVCMHACMHALCMYVCVAGAKENVRRQHRS